MGCFFSRRIPANKYIYVHKQRNKSGKQLLRALNTLLKQDNEECIGYGPESVERVLLRALGFSDLQEKQMSVRFEEKPRSEQEDILLLIYIYMNWKDLKQDFSVIEALKETKFVTSADGELYKPKDLFDPDDSLLSSVFSGEAHKFPGERFASGGWLDILRKTGLRNTADADVVLECARRIELLGAESMKPLQLANDNKQEFSQMSIEVSVEIWSLAETLMSAIFKNFDILHGNNGFCVSLGEIACIPAEKGFPFENGNKGGKRVLCSYSEAILLKDWPLAWRVAPIVSRDSMVPPEYSWGALQLRSPPPFTIVLKHLKDPLETESSLLSIEEAVYEVLRYLEGIWGTLSSSDLSKLQKLPFIPVANSTLFVNPFCIYCLPTVDLYPLAFELPSCYLPFVKILKEVGLHHMISVSSAMFVLSRLKKACGNERLSPNELRGVVKVLNFICNETKKRHKSDRYNWESELVVPDDACRLVPPNSCVFIDPYGSQYVKYIDSSKVKLVHHDVSEQLCLAFGIRKLSDVVVEELDCAEHLLTLEEIGSVSLAAIKQDLLNLSFQVAVLRVLISSSITGSQNANFQVVKRALESVAKGLQFVESIYSQFWLHPNYVDINNVSREPIIPERECQFNHRAHYYVDRSDTCMLIAKPPIDVSVLDLVAIVISHVLGSFVPLPIGSLFFCLKDPIHNIPELIPCDKSVMDSVGCGIGFLGREVHPEDAKKAYFFRVRPFHKGAIVGWKTKQGEKLKYGRIVEDVRPAKQALDSVNLETSPDKTETVKSSLVYSFHDFTIG